MNKRKLKKQIKSQGFKNCVRADVKLPFENRIDISGDYDEDGFKIHNKPSGKVKHKGIGASKTAWQAKNVEHTSWNAIQSTKASCGTYPLTKKRNLKKITK